MEEWEMPIEYENLAMRIIESGQLRIDTDVAVNFIRYSSPYDRYFKIFGYRELFDKKLVPSTFDEIKSSLSSRFRGKDLESKTVEVIESLRNRIKMLIAVSEEVEKKIARILVQTIDPIVISLILLEHTDIFVTYSHNVGDMLDMVSWQQVGSSSGLQSNDYIASSVFVSCGGNPFAELNKEGEYDYPYDGKAAIARLMIIGGQELGHFSDIIRDRRGYKVSRHSTNMYSTYANPHVKKARLDDIENANIIEQKLLKIGLAQLAELERHIIFYQKRKRNDSLVKNTIAKHRKQQNKFIYNLNKLSLSKLLDLPKHKHLATEITKVIADMKFNLAPEADAYKRDDEDEEEAIACAEALARVPQQANKWGHNVTKIFMADLYKIYYNEVIPACKKTYENLTGQKFYFPPFKRRGEYRRKMLNLENKFKSFFISKKDKEN